MGLSVPEPDRVQAPCPRLARLPDRAPIPLYRKSLHHTAHPFGLHSSRWRPRPRWKRIPNASTMVVMFQVGLFAMHVLEVMFFVGMAGSAIVVVISFIEDAQELFGED